jgi:hypothetical protein
MWIKAFEIKYHGKGRPFGRVEWDSLLGHSMVNFIFVFIVDLKARFLKSESTGIVIFTF